jgi:hypothetical protein
MGEGEGGGNSTHDTAPIPAFPRFAGKAVRFPDRPSRALNQVAVTSV